MAWPPSTPIRLAIRRSWWERSISVDKEVKKNIIIEQLHHCSVRRIKFFPCTSHHCTVITASKTHRSLYSGLNEDSVQTAKPWWLFTYFSSLQTPFISYLLPKEYTSYMFSFSPCSLPRKLIKAFNLLILSLARKKSKVQSVTFSVYLTKRGKASAISSPPSSSSFQNWLLPVFARKHSPLHETLLRSFSPFFSLLITENRLGFGNNHSHTNSEN